MVKFKFSKLIKKMHVGRILLVTLVALSFFGFILWYINQAQMEESGNADAIKLARPLENKIIKIESPKINATISSPLNIKGQAAITDGTLKARIKDLKGLVLGESNISIKNSQKLIPFSVGLKYKKPSTAKGTVEVFRVASKDKTETFKISIPVVFKN